MCFSNILGILDRISTHIRYPLLWYLRYADTQEPNPFTLGSWWRNAYAVLFHPEKLISPRDYAPPLYQNRGQFPEDQVITGGPQIGAD
jgi:hypothetical protein